MNSKKLKEEAKWVAFSETENLLLNMAGGLLPENLTVQEVALLEEEFGHNWFKILGYEESEHKKAE